MVRGELVPDGRDEASGAAYGLVGGLVNVVYIITGGRGSGWKVSVIDMVIVGRQEMWNAY